MSFRNLSIGLIAAGLLITGCESKEVRTADRPTQQTYGYVNGQQQADAQAQAQQDQIRIQQQQQQRDAQMRTQPQAQQPQQRDMWVDEATSGPAGAQPQRQQDQQRQPQDRQQQRDQRDAAAAQPGARSIEMIARDYAFEPNEIRVDPGTKINLTLRNTGEAKHNIEFELPQGEKALQNPIEPGQTANMTFTAPQEPGDYTFYCPVGNHRERGMVGKLIVEAGQPQPAGRQPGAGEAPQK